MQSRRRTAEQWKSVIREYQASGLSGIKFCKRESIHPKSFYRAKSLYGKSSGRNRFIQAAAPALPRGEITVVLPTARVICSGTVSSSWVADLLRRL